MTDQHPRPLSNDEIIARLTAEGIRAVACLACGKVKEVVNDKVVMHYATPPTLCPGSNFDTLGDVDETFATLTHGIEVPQTPDDYGRMATETAVGILQALLQAVEDNGGKQVQGASGEIFCGCVSCIVREVLVASWGYACHAQFIDITDFLMSEASKEGMDRAHRDAAARLAQRIIDRQSGDDE